MIIAIERNRFIYLYKYNKISVDANQIIDLPVSKIIKLLNEGNVELVSIFDKILPVFEQDHEIILLEVDKNYISVESKLNIYFQAILSIYPLTNIGSQLLQGKINNDFIVNEPVFERIIGEVKIIRSLDNRNIATQNLLKIFSLTIEKEKMLMLDDSLRRILLDNNFKLYLDYLITYNKTPNNIPDGNVEFLCKIGIIVLNYLKIDDANFFKGPFYKSCLLNKDTINTDSIFESYSMFVDLKDAELQSSFENLKSKIDLVLPHIDIFKASYFFLAYKSFLNKNDKNLVLLKSEIEQLIFDDERTAAFVLAMIGYTFSFELLYESLHVLAKASVLKSVKSNPIKNEMSQSVQNKLQTTRFRPNNDLKNIRGNEIIVVKQNDIISEPIIILESAANNSEVISKDLTLFAHNERDDISEKTILNKTEVYKTIPEIKDWINTHKNISKSALSSWTKFINEDLKYGTYSLNEILKKIEISKLEKKLTSKIIKDLTYFYR